MQKLIANANASILFLKAPALHFYPEIDICSSCGSMLHVQKTASPKAFVTMDIGAFNVKETVLFCPQDRKTFFSEQLQKAHRLLAKIMDIHLRGNIKNNKSFYQIYRTFKEVVEDKQLDELASSLERKAEVFADPLPVSTSEGVVYIQPQRTKNILERFSRGKKR